MKPIRVLIADDHAVLRAGLRLLVNWQDDMEVVGEAADGAEAVARAREKQPDVLTLDLVMPGGNGLETLAQLRRECPATRVLVLTMHDDPAYLRAVLAAGGSGYVVKTAADTELLSGIRAVHQGRIFVNLSLTDGAVQTMVNPPSSARHVLSAREREVVMLLAQGFTNQETADRLFLSVKTIETYRGRLMAKLGLESRADLVRYAMENGLLGSNPGVPLPRIP